MKATLIKWIITQRTRSPVTMILISRTASGASQNSHRTRSYQFELQIDQGQSVNAADDPAMEDYVPDFSSFDGREFELALEAPRPLPKVWEMSAMDCVALWESS
jgi:hypothetical protein